MAQDPSFDIVSEVDLQVVDDVVNVAMKEIGTRFDFKGTNAKIDFNRKEKSITFSAQSAFQLDQVKDILSQKMAKRGMSSKALKSKGVEEATGGSARETCELITGIETDLAKKIVKDIKDTKLKVQASIQDEKIRVSGKSKDDLQDVIKLVKENDYSIPLQFVNYR